MKLNIVEVGDPVLRRMAQPLSADEIRSARIQQLIGLMRDTMRDAPGVGLAAPKVGAGVQLAVVEDRVEYNAHLSAEQLAERQRSPVAFHVVINPKLSILESGNVEFFETCLSVSGFGALVCRASKIRVECLNEKAEPVTIDATGWYARILQHEIDHLNGTVYIDRMSTRSFMTVDHWNRYWKDRSVEEFRAELGIDLANFST
ncbi:MAG: peptide deformylase [Blastocatellia bacterium]|jgi:peptide deformylase|nr:peptide deformylase [Blastocatellia bacterium]